ncbi:MAG: hypothetical protein L6R35_007528 [Caloplaca aegaea]|nr:MAG: hypothetical protein L6R35_007528 [Caloplaca aegaea]
MTTITSKPHLENYDPSFLQAISDRTRGTGSTPSSNYMTIEQAANYMDRLGEEAMEFGRHLRATGQQTADGYNVGGSPPSAAEIVGAQQRTVDMTKSYIEVIKSASDFLSKDNLDWLASVSGKDRVAAYIASVTEGVARAKSGLESLQTSATAHLGLQGQLAIQDGNGNYQLGAFVLTSTSADHTIRTGSNGATQIAHHGEEFQPYSPSQSLTSIDPAKPPLDVTA